MEHEMTKIILTIFLLISFLRANYEIIENENLFIVKTNNTDFETNLTNLKNEINFESVEATSFVDFATFIS
jgi:hypothetical protein